jgi:hypothetical protein
MKFDGIYQFNEKGVKKFNELFEDKFSKNIVLNPDFELLKDPEYVDFIAGSNIFDTNDCVDNISMVNVITNSVGGSTNARTLLGNKNALMWLTYALLNLLISNSDGIYKVRQKARYFPPDLNQARKLRDYKHLIFSRLRLSLDFSDVAKPFLVSVKPHIIGEINENVLSRKESYAKNYFQLIAMLYFDKESNQWKDGTGGSDEGSPRDLFRFLKQLSVVWSTSTMTAGELYSKLPPIFDQYKN